MAQDIWLECGTLPPLSINELKSRLADLDREHIFEIYAEITKYLALRFDTNPIDLASELIEIFTEQSTPGKALAFSYDSNKENDETPCIHSNQ